MKKFLALALVVIMISAFAMPAFAKSESQIQITFDPTAQWEKYVIEVPDTLTLGGAAGQIVVSQYENFKEGHCLMVDVVSDFKFGEIKNAFALKIGGEDVSAAYFDAANERIAIAAVKTENTPTAGEHEGYITYNCMIVKTSDIY